mgnify:CR=1 FL=1
MLKILQNNKTILLFRIILGVIFIYASIDKIIDPASFSDSIDNYHITPIQINNLVAILLPWIELIVGVCLLTGYCLEGAITIVIVLLIWFIFIISQALFRGIDLDCGCFDLSQKSENLNLKIEMIKRIIEDFVFLMFAIIIKYKKTD